LEKSTTRHDAMSVAGPTSFPAHSHLVPFSEQQFQSVNAYKEPSCIKPIDYRKQMRGIKNEIPCSRSTDDIMDDIVELEENPNENLDEDLYITDSRFIFHNTFEKYTFNAVDDIHDERLIPTSPINKPSKPERKTPRPATGTLSPFVSLPSRNELSKHPVTVHIPQLNYGHTSDVYTNHKTSLPISPIVEDENDLELSFVSDDEDENQYISTDSAADVLKLVEAIEQQEEQVKPKPKKLKTSVPLSPISSQLVDIEAPKIKTKKKKKPVKATLGLTETQIQQIEKPRTPKAFNNSDTVIKAASRVTFAPPATQLKYHSTEVDEFALRMLKTMSKGDFFKKKISLRSSPGSRSQGLYNLSYKK
jgi:hypothetical protein